MVATALSRTESPIFGISIVNENDHPIFASNNLWLKQPVEYVNKGQKIEANWSVPNIFNNGKLYINAAVATDNGTSVIDRIEKVDSFTVRNKLPNGSYTNPEHTMSITIRK